MNLPGTVMDVIPVDDIDRAVLDENGRLRAAYPAATFTAFPPAQLRLWCHLRARYALPTLELIKWLRNRIAGRSALEIGAGNADLGYLLGIRETDSGIQQGDAKAFFLLSGQPPTNPPPTVRRMDALDAIDKFRPQVVVAAWFTRKFIPGQDREGQAQGSIFGVRDEDIIDRVETYIHIGNEKIHGQKTALRLPHETIKLPGLLSRTSDQATNVIYVWDRK